MLSQLPQRYTDDGKCSKLSRGSKRLEHEFIGQFESAPHLARFKLTIIDTGKCFSNFASDLPQIVHTYTLPQEEFRLDGKSYYGLE